MTTFKYKPCCNSTCLLSYCETRDQGGCYCVCKLKDWEGICLSILDDKIKGKELQLIREKLKEYEVNNAENLNEYC